jgi:DNA polymerase-3 subunit alpha
MSKIEGFEHLHLHTDFSLLDGYGQVEEYAERAPKINQKFLCISDHGAMGAVPRQIRACEKNKISPIFACELYINPLQPQLKPGEKTGDYYKEMDDENKKTLSKSNHLLAIAHSNAGYSNLVRLSSWGWIHGFYRKPRINHEVLQAHKEGIIFTSCCYNSEVGWAFERGGANLADSVIERYVAMLGKENYRLEIMLLDFVKQKPYNAYIVAAARKYGLKIILTQDCHYCNQEDSKFQRLMLMIQTGKTVQQIEAALAANQDEDLFELQDSNLWMKSEEELNEKWLKDYSDVIDYDVLAEAKRETVNICNMAKGVTLDRSIKLPKLPDADQKLKDAIMAGFKKRGLPMNREYLDRIKEEYSLICQKEFSSYFLIQKMMTDEARDYWAKKTGGSGDEAVGPGRGSGAGSLVCYCLRITDINPIPHDLLFSRFLSPARGGKSMKLRFGIEPIPA